MNFDVWGFFIHHHHHLRPAIALAFDSVEAFQMVFYTILKRLYACDILIRSFFSIFKFEQEQEEDEQKVAYV